MKRLILCLGAFLFAVSLCFGQEAKIGEVLPAWQEGELDIHFINTGHGECHWMIFPDGTTFLVDASGSMKRDYKENQEGAADWKPNEIASPGRTIVNYINHFSPEVSKGHINYFMLTHHHSDHMGQLTKDTPWHDNNLFRLTSLCEIGSLLVMDKIFDRDWPNFSFPKEDTGGMMTNYQNFLRWTKRKNKSKIEKWDVGSSKQVVLLHDKSYDFTIRNLAGNGCNCTANEGEYVSYLPPKQVFETMDSKGYPDENILSCAYMLSYGKFDFYAGGDLRYWGRDKYPHKDAESPLIPFVHKVEVMKANHHGNPDANCAEFLNKLAPDVWIVGVWRYYMQPSPRPVNALLNASPNCDIFCTFQSDTNLGKLVAKLGFETVDRHFVGKYGHVVVRVAPGGDSYMIYTLEDSNEEYRVKSIHGPYQCSDPN